MKAEELELTAIVRARSLPADLQRIAYAGIERAMQLYRVGALSEQALANLLDRPRPGGRGRHSASRAA